MNKVEHDAEWIEGIRRGDVEIYRLVFLHFAPKLVRFAQLSVPFEIAEDVVQDVLFNLWRRSDDLYAREGLAVYLFGAVRNRIANHFRHERVVRQSTRDGESVSFTTMGEAAASPDSDVIDNDFITSFRQVLHRLSPLQREVISLRWEHEMTYEQIALALAITVDAARQHGSRARRTLRPLIDRFLLANSSDD